MLPYLQPCSREGCHALQGWHEDGAACEPVLQVTVAGGAGLGAVAGRAEDGHLSAPAANNAMAGCTDPIQHQQALLLCT